jgi:hypothetical protein
MALSWYELYLLLLVLPLRNLKSINFWIAFQERIPAPVPDRTKEDILLFFKLYHPEKEELRYVTNIGVLVFIWL